MTGSFNPVQFSSKDAPLLQGPLTNLGCNICESKIFQNFKKSLISMLLCLFHFAVCIKYEQKLGLLIAFPMIFELVLLYSGLQGMDSFTIWYRGKKIFENLSIISKETSAIHKRLWKILGKKERNNSTKSIWNRRWRN